MRKPLIAGNWKMYTTAEEAKSLLQNLVSLTASVSNVDIAVFPPAIYLGVVQDILKDTAILWGGQNMAWEPQGAFTGEISSRMLLDMGSALVLLGHSERRHIFRETDALIRSKINRALEDGLIPVICVGETLDEREAGKTEAVVLGQLEAALKGMSAETAQKAILAYEPVWAIGTGKTASPEQAQEVHATIRHWLETQFNKQLAGSLRILYGGSVKPDNAKGLLSQTDIDGALVGGASLKADVFYEIIMAAKA